MTRDPKTFARDLMRKPPMIFPWVALLHLGLLIYVLWQFMDEPFPSPGWLQPLWILGYTIAWLYACDLRKWAGYLYLALTSLDLILYVTMMQQPVSQALYTSSLFLVSVLLSFFILFYFNRFE